MTGLRERKKQATRVALREAALRLALEHGAANVRVDDIAEAAGVSPRTYNNYFSSREEAIVAAVTADRESRIAAAVAERLPDTPLAKAIVDAITEQYTDPSEQSRDALLLITTNPGLRTAFLDAPAALENPLQEAIAARIGDPQTARVLAASVAAAVRVALEQWTRPAGNGLVVVSGSLPDLLRRMLEPLVPAFDAAEAD
ncbi:TetR/AcrR family transcriptional regulator [Amycolatopsis circi]|uniref:TetR/AcrR family transcriptional regulator n=1 Tax=Amycolatopsis circi TaxID=871959 RepID=UPI000E26B669|nr:TetR/AcrR family transcriptional regulator [Amycolatopsis circi]